MTASNPLINPPEIKEGAPALDTVKPEHFLPAIDDGIAKAKQRIDAIKQEKNPDFENVIVALEYADRELDDAASVFSNFKSVMHDDAMDAEVTVDGKKTTIVDAVEAKLTNFGSDIMLDDDLFKQIKAVHDKFENGEITLNAEQERLLDRTYKSFTRNGALLNDADKQRLREIDEELSRLSTVFSKNVMDSIKNFELWIDDEDDLAGLPKSALAMAKESAKEKGKPDKYLLTMQAPSVIAVLTYADDRNLREKIWRAYTRQGTEQKTDNRPVIQQKLKLRQERAELLGYDNHADYVLEDRMAKDAKTVNDMLEHFKDKVKDAAEEELDELRTFAQDEGGPAPADFRPWDQAYYAEKMKQDKFGFDSEELRPYFRFEDVVKGCFEVAGKLYDIDIKESTDYPVYHKDVTAFELTDKSSGELIGILYTDFFPRDHKKSGAWESTYRKQSAGPDGEKIVPIVGIHGNFTKPTSDSPSLLTIDEVETFFHEFGHALHDLLSDVTYPSLAGTNVLWDFVELPSQIMENWVKEKQVLDMFAKHHETGDAIPEELVQKLKDSEHFRKASMFFRQLRFGTLDMAYHTTDPDTIKDVEAFEHKTCKDFDLLPTEDGVMSPSFGHLFAGGYAAGYYSYKWAEILDADAFELFQEKGLFDKETAKKFREMLSKGGTMDPAELYRKFRGRDADQDALLRRDGLLPPANDDGGENKRLGKPRRPSAKAVDPKVVERKTDKPVDPKVVERETNNAVEFNKIAKDKPANDDTAAKPPAPKRRIGNKPPRP